MFQEASKRPTFAEISGALLERAGDGLRNFGLNLRGYGGYKRKDILTLEQRPWIIDKFYYDENNAVQVELSWPTEENPRGNRRTAPFNEMHTHYVVNGPGQSETMARFYSNRSIFDFLYND